MRSKRFDLIGVISVLAMLTSLALLVAHNETGFGELGVELTQEDLAAGFREGIEVHALYMGAEKVGTLRTEKRRDGNGYRIDSSMQLSVSTGFFKQRLRSELLSRLDEGFRLQEFELSLDSAILELELEGRWDGSAMVITGLPGETSSVALEMPEAPLILPSLRPVMMRKRLEPGSKTSLDYFDPLSQSRVRLDVVFVGNESIEVMGRLVNAFHFKEMALGRATDVWVNELGEVLIEDLPMGFRAVREPEAEAEYGLSEATAKRASLPDAVSLEAIASATLERALWSKSKWTIERGQVLRGVFQEAGQSITFEDQRAIVEVQRLALQRVGKAGLSEGLQAEYVGSASEIDPSAPEVVALASRLAPENAPLDEVLQAATQHVSALGWASEQASVDAAAVLRSGKGSSLGRANALTALLRARGIPARVVYGALFMGDGVLNRHDWVEAHVREWIPLDPSLGQAPADAGRLRLGSGGALERTLAEAALRTLRISSVEGE
ncbi:MAG: transglutaminase-like domain-containing protein [Myxococcota bacterium]|nr:transglutaminase-like domain-containing protein [Myxococcota bacterium]